MSRQGSRRVTFSPDINDRLMASIYAKANAKKQREGERRGDATTFSPSRNGTAYGFSPSYRPSAAKLSPGRCLRCIRTGMATVVRFFCMRRIRRRRRCCTASAKVSAVSMSHRFLSPSDSHYSEAIEDCIEFINASYRKDLY